MKEEMFSFVLSGKTAVVTGGTCSIGQTMALALAGAGADIILPRSGILVSPPHHTDDNEHVNRR
ncbi:hypothetical protein B9Z19DRAFT_1088928 [Tuber borchii]|uniref:Uncharacterized protein n=1 Tax=Tuber borchii TaxID=42251 RepID=A0A2T6ZKX3_TUBBO|nr:hypothetical protein B9Z19DRAFT_1088928 [Tuber borchii]